MVRGKDRAAGNRASLGVMLCAIVLSSSATASEAELDAAGLATFTIVATRASELNAA